MGGKKECFKLPNVWLIYLLVQLPLSMASSVVPPRGTIPAEAYILGALNSSKGTRVSLKEFSCSLPSYGNATNRIKLTL